MTLQEPNEPAAVPQDGEMDKAQTPAEQAVSGSPEDREPAAVPESPVKEDLDEERWYELEQCYVTFEQFKTETHRGRDVMAHMDEEAAIEHLKNLFQDFETRAVHEDHGDRWALQEMANTEKPWKLMNTQEKVITSIVGFVKFCCIWGVLYLFIIALGLMGNAFKIVGGKSSGKTFREAELISNPVAGLCIGVLATVLMQSSSTTTSIVISMAAARLVTVENAAYLVMGANIGTSVTNTIVSIAHLNSPAEYRRAFTGAVFHDMFNWLSVGIFLPLEASSGFLMELAAEAVDSMGLSDDDDSRSKTEFIKKITKPASGRVTSVDKGLIEKIAEAETSEEVKELEKKTIIKQKSGHVMRNSPVGDDNLGVLLLFVSLTMLTTCLLLLVKLLQSVLKGRVAVWTRYLLNIDFKNPYLRMCGGLDSYILLLFGTGCTILVQSSSVFTSTLTPLVGIGLIHIEKVTSLTHGANIGTTVTGILSALSGDNVATGMRVALEHVFFNVLGTFVWFCIWPLRPVPLAMAKFMGETAASLRWFPLVYIITCFLALPGLVILLALPGWEVLLAVGLPILLMVATFVVFVWVRRNRADLLPWDSALRSEEFCGREVPNFLKLWGGDLKLDMVDVQALQEKERKAKEKLDSVAPWPYSPAAWGLCILAFLGLTLSLPTAQWRRIGYGKDKPVGRKEIGFSFDEVCSDAYKKDISYAPSLSHEINEALFFNRENNVVTGCAAKLNLQCEADDAWATQTDNGEKDQMKGEKSLYKWSFHQCSKLGVQAGDWDRYCKELPACRGRQYHEKRCKEPLSTFEHWEHTGMDRTNVEFIYAEPTSSVVPEMLVHDNQFPSDENDDDDGDTLKTVKLDLSAGSGNVEPVSGLSFDACSGNMFGSTVNTLAQTLMQARLVASYTSAKKSTSHSTDNGFQFPQNLAIRNVQVLDGSANVADETFIGTEGRSLVTFSNTAVLDRLTVPGPANANSFSTLAVAAKKDRAVACEDPRVQGSNAMRCHLFDVTDPSDLKLTAIKVVLLRAPVEYNKALPSGSGPFVQDDIRIAGTSFVEEKEIKDQPDEYKFKVMFLEVGRRLESNTAGGKVAASMFTVDFRKGTDIQNHNNAGEVDGITAGENNNAAVGLAKRDIQVATMMKFYDLSKIKKSTKEGEEGSLDIRADLLNGFFMIDEFAFAMTETSDAARSHRIHVVNWREKQIYEDFESSPDSACPKTKAGKFLTKESTCRDMDDICPEGGLKGDMQAVKGLTITGAVMLGIGMVTLVTYTFVPHHPVIRFFIYVAAGTMFLAWVFLLASWARVLAMEEETYTCWFQDESLRGGFVKVNGKLKYITMQSYSWAFCIFAWCMLTISLAFVLQRVICPGQAAADAVEEEEDAEPTKDA